MVFVYQCHEIKSSLLFRDVKKYENNLAVVLNCVLGSYCMSMEKNCISINIII